jgi:hypothetical protein
MMQGGKIKKNRENLLVLANTRLTIKKKFHGLLIKRFMPFWHENYH